MVTAPSSLMCWHMEGGLGLAAVVLDLEFQVGITERQSSLPHSVSRFVCVF